MRWSDIQFDPTRATLRQFAGLWLAFFGGLALWQGLVRGQTGLASIFAVLALKTFLKTDYRGPVQMLDDFAELRQELGLAKVPHYSTLCKAERRLLKKGASASCSAAPSAAPACAA